MSNELGNSTEKDRSYCVYVHTNKVNGKKYVGQTCQCPPEKRWKKDGSGYKHNEYFYNSIQKYGWDNFAHEIIKDNLMNEEANKLEEFLINKFDTLNRSNGYNFRHGGNNGRHSKETKEKLKKAWEHRNRIMPEHVKQILIETNTGRIMSEETRRKISEAQKGKPRYYARGKNNPNFGRQYSEEERRQMSERMKGANNPNYGKHFSEEHKRKLSKSNMGHRALKGAENPKARKVAQYTKDNKFIKIWDCMRDASRSLTVNPSHITACCRGKRKSAGGFVWKYIDEN